MELIIKDNCFLCNKKFGWHEVIIGKLPENCWFCQNCIETFEDKKEYKGIESWITLEYENGTILKYITGKLERNRYNIN